MPGPLLATASGLLMASALSAQTAALDAPGRARIDTVFHRFAGGPGCALGVIQGDALAYARGYGLASVEFGVPITPTTVFDLGSVSKQFTALAIVLLAQDGRLSLDDEVQKHVPEVPRYARPVTIRHLLHHTSGLRDYIDILSWSGVADETVTGDRDALEAIARQTAPNFAAGDEYRYSNSGYFLLSVIVKRVSGESLRDFAARRIFGPLGMTRTQFLDRHEMIVPGKAGSYAAARGGGSFVLALANWEQTGDGAVNTTVEDMVKWNRNFSTGTVGGAAGIRLLETTAPLNDGKPNNYGFGQVMDSLRGVRRVSHGGSWAGFRAHFARYPDHGLSTVILCNLATAGPGLLAEQVAATLLEGKLRPADSARAFVPFPGTGGPGARPVPVPAGIAGRYRSPELLADWIVTVRGDSAFARPGLGAEFPLQSTRPDTLFAFGTRITVLRDGARITALSLTNRGLRDLRLRKVEE